MKTAGTSSPTLPGEGHAECLILDSSLKARNRRLNNVRAGAVSSGNEYFISLQVDRELVLGTGEGETDSLLTGKQRPPGEFGDDPVQFRFSQFLVAAAFIWRLSLQQE